MTKTVGDSEAGIRHAFRVARALAPAVLVLDEVDAIAGRRGGEEVDDDLAAAETEADVEGEEDESVAGDDGPTDDTDGSEDKPVDDGVFVPGYLVAPSPAAAAADAASKTAAAAPDSATPPPLPPLKQRRTLVARPAVMERMLATLLNELDGVGVASAEAESSARLRRAHSQPSSSSSSAPVPVPEPAAPVVLVVGTTNRAAALDPALLRPGRLEVHVAVGPLATPGQRLALLRKRVRHRNYYRAVTMSVLAGLPHAAGGRRRLPAGRGGVAAAYHHACRRGGAGVRCCDGRHRRDSGGSGGGPARHGAL